MKSSPLSPLDQVPYFSIEAVRQLLGDGSAAGTVQTALYRWMKAGEVLQLKRGLYMTRRFHEIRRADADLLPAVSAILIPQSYVSLEYVLQRHGVLTDVTYPITAVTLKQTRTITNRLGTFTYRNIKPALYTGFALEVYLGIPFARAILAKALFDLLYFRSSFLAAWPADYSIAEDLRLDLGEFQVEQREAFAGFVRQSGSLKMARVLKNLRETIWRP